MLQRLKGTALGRQARSVVLRARRHAYPRPEVASVQAVSLEAEHLHVLVRFPGIGDLDPAGLAPFASLEYADRSLREEVPSEVMRMRLDQADDGTRSLTVLLSLPSPTLGIPSALVVGDRTGHLPGTSVPLGEPELTRMACESLRDYTPAEADAAYDTWFRSHRATDRQLDAQRREAARWDEGPLFSVVVPLYHTPVPYLVEMADSVLGQTYPHLELVMVNSTPQDADLSRVVARIAASDARVTVVTLDHNLGISKNTEAGVRAAKGDLIAFFDHDDVLEPNILFEYAMRVREDPSTDMIYCDEDLLVDGTYRRPAFKSDWSLVQEETNNYVCHMLTMRRELVDGFYSRYDGAQDHRLTLVAGSRARHVGHVPKVLYHWRAHPGSTANSAVAKAESFEAGRLAIEDHLGDLGLPAKVESIPTMPHCYRFTLDFPEPPLVSAVVMGMDQPAAEARAQGLRDILTWPNLELIPQVGTLGEDYADCVNEGVARTTGDYVLVVASDVVVQSPDLVEQLLSLAVRRGHAIAGTKVLCPDGTIQCAGMTLQRGGAVPIGRFLESFYGTGKGYLVLPHDLSAVSGECVLFRREVFQAVGGAVSGLDETNWAVALCIQAGRLGLGTCIAPMAHVARCLPPAASPFDDEEAKEWARQQERLLGMFPAEFRTRDPYYSASWSPDGLFRLRGDED